MTAAAPEVCHELVHVELLDGRGLTPACTCGWYSPARSHSDFERHLTSKRRADRHPLADWEIAPERRALLDRAAKAGKQATCADETAATTSPTPQPPAHPNTTTAPTPTTAAPSHSSATTQPAGTHSPPANSPTTSPTSPTTHTTPTHTAPASTQPTSTKPDSYSGDGVNLRVNVTERIER